MPPYIHSDCDLQQFCGQAWNNLATCFVVMAGVNVQIKPPMATGSYHAVARDLVLNALKDSSEVGRVSK